MNLWEQRSFRCSLLRSNRRERKQLRETHKKRTRNAQETRVRTMGFDVDGITRADIVGKVERRNRQSDSWCWSVYGPSSIQSTLNLVALRKFEFPFDRFLRGTCSALRSVLFPAVANVSLETFNRSVLIRLFTNTTATNHSVRTKAWINLCDLPIIASFSIDRWVFLHRKFN